jgi:hypothetical protein
MFGIARNGRHLAKPSLIAKRPSAKFKGQTEAIRHFAYLTKKLDYLSHIAHTLQPREGRFAHSMLECPAGQCPLGLIFRGDQRSVDVEI